ncbi:MAG: 1-phosphofructokinase family hexose kinase [Actinomycetes bacterium]
MTPTANQPTDQQRSDSPPSLFVFAAVPLLTITIEAGPDDEPQIHLHAGGQGVWIARMAATLGLDVRLCGSFGGETGNILTGMIEAEGIRLRAVPAAGSNGAYIHDRRSGERIEVADMAPTPLSRHDIDELYGASLAEGMGADVAVLAGPRDDRALPNDTYARLAADLSTAGRRVVADLSGDPLTEALKGGLTVLKVSDEDLVEDGRAASPDPSDLRRAMDELVTEGAQHVVISRAGDPALALADGRLYEVVAPELTMVDHRGAGDSMTAGIAAGLARGLAFPEALRLGAAAGAVNVTRLGLATGQRDVIDRLVERVAVREQDDKE